MTTIKMGEFLTLEDKWRHTTERVVVTKIGRKWISVTRSDGEIFRFNKDTWKPDSYAYQGHVLKREE